MSSSSSKTTSSSSNTSKSSTSSANSTKRPKIVVNPAQFKRRLDSELRYFKAHSKDASCKYKLVAVEAEHRKWEIIFLPDKEPFNAGAYRMIVEFPMEYPFRHPVLMFKTKIYHPNIGEKGNMELGFCNAEAWKPTIRMFQLCDFIISLLNYPDPICGVLRKDIADLMLKHREVFIKEATTQAKKYGEIHI
uniref:UBC core domain-containing protein n=1 Tax=Panagrolaimus sp. PS1159 TaxID=55785 RepID=A0AC35F2N8_9BILA